MSNLLEMVRERRAQLEAEAAAERAARYGPITDSQRAAALELVVKRAKREGGQGQYTEMLEKVCGLLGPDFRKAVEAYMATPEPRVLGDDKIQPEREETPWRAPWSSGPAGESAADYEGPPIGAVDVFSVEPRSFRPPALRSWPRVVRNDQDKVDPGTGWLGRH